MVWYGLAWFDVVWYGLVGWGECTMTSEFINEEISMLFCSKKFSGGWWVGGWWWYGVIMESISRSRPETRECL